MSKLFYKAMIEDVQREKCSHKEVEYLLDSQPEPGSAWFCPVHVLI